MRILCALAIAAVVCGTLPAQHHGGGSPGHTGATSNGAWWNGYHHSPRYSGAATAVAVPYVYPVVDPDNAPLVDQASTDSYQPTTAATGGYDSYGQASPAAAEPPPHSVLIDLEGSDQAAAPEPPHYYIALKDHHIYLTVAYWVQGNTIHYFLPGNLHNQVSLALVDYDLTQRLNRESGVDVRLPTGK